MQGDSMSFHPFANQNLFLVKEHAGLFKAANNFDVFNPDGGKVMECREPNLGLLTKLLRFTDYKRMTPFEVVINGTDGRPVLTVRRGISLFLSKVDVLNGAGVRIGGFKQKLFSIGGAFSVLDSRDNEVCTLKGKWTSWEFRFLRGDRELAKVSKKWAGLGKELLTTADNYVLTIDAGVPENDNVRLLILAAVMCIDMVLKE
jgi:uncharacterized protein YxjI